MIHDEAQLQQCLNEAITESVDIAYRLMQTERNRWRSCAIQMADILYKRLPNLPDLDDFYQLLNETSPTSDT
jgi:hypothetical protein